MPEAPCLQGAFFIGGKYISVFYDISAQMDHLSALRHDIKTLQPYWTHKKSPHHQNEVALLMRL